LIRIATPISTRTLKVGAAALLPTLFLAACAANQGVGHFQRLALAEAQAALPVEPRECAFGSGPRIAPVRATDIPTDLFRDERSAWAIVRYDMKGGVVTEASVVASSPARLLDTFALKHVRTHANPAAPDASGCVVTVQISTS
jgi:hypothetical protein